MADYKTRLTADTSQHDAALKKSAQQVYSYKKNVESAKTNLGGLIKKFGPLAAQVGIAGGAFALLKKTITSTEAGADAFNRALYVGKTTVDSFFKSISTGNFDSFISGLKEIKKTAEEAFDALDALGSITNYNNARVAELQAKIEQQRTIILNPKKTADDKKVAQTQIKIYEQQIEALNAEILDAGEKAAEKLIKQLAQNSHIDDAEIQRWLKMKAQGTLENYIKNYASQHSSTITHRGVSAGNNRFAGPTSYSWTETRWEKGAQEIYNAMQAVLAASEEEGEAYANWLQVRTANAQRIIQAEKEKQRLFKLDAKVDKATTPTTNEPKFDAGSIADLEQQISELENRLKNENLVGGQRRALEEEIKLLQYKKECIEESSKPLEKLGALIEEMPKLDERIIDGDAITAELQKVIDQIEETGLTIEDLENLENVGDSVGYIGDSFKSLAGIMDEESGKMFSAIGNSITAIGEMIAKISSLMLAEGAASVMDLPFPANMAALASVIATITSVIAAIQSTATQSFADGGIFQGKTTVGDYNFARVNAGEMILNNRQQQHLFNLLNGNTQVNAVTDGGNVTFTIHGSDLQGTLNNYNKRVNRVR